MQYRRTLTAANVLTSGAVTFLQVWLIRECVFNGEEQLEKYLGINLSFQLTLIALIWLLKTEFITNLPEKLSNSCWQATEVSVMLSWIWPLIKNADYFFYADQAVYNVFDYMEIVCLSLVAIIWLVFLRRLWGYEHAQ